MMADLLAKRFALRTHVEQRPVNVYVLKLARDDGQLGDQLIFTALQEQLGLTLEPAREVVDVRVIDSVERPTPD